MTLPLCTPYIFFSFMLTMLLVVCLLLLRQLSIFCHVSNVVCKLCVFLPPTPKIHSSLFRVSIVIRSEIYKNQCTMSPVFHVQPVKHIVAVANYMSYYYSF